MTHTPSRPDTRLRLSDLPAVPAGPAQSAWLRLDVSYPSAHAAVLTARGEIDDVSLPRFAEQLEQQLERPGSTLVLDFSAVRFLNVSTLSVLATAAHEARRDAVSLRVVVTSPEVWRALEVAGLPTDVEHHHSVVDALERH